MTNHFDDYGSRHLSFEACERLAMQIRARIGCSGGEPVPPIAEALNRMGIVPEVRSANYMGDALASAKLATKDIEIREDLIDEILKDSPLARFTLLHEVAHLADHGHLKLSKLFRKSSGNELFRFYTPDESVEGQADSIADAVAMPIDMVNTCANAKELAQTAGMPLSRAFARFNIVRSRFGRRLSSVERATVAELRAQTAATPAERRTREQEAKKLRLWSALPEIDGEDSTVARRCGRYRIFWIEFGRTTDCGWLIEGDEIVSYFALRYGP